MALNRIAQIPGRVTNLEAEQMSGVAIPRRTTGDMAGLLLDGSDDDELEGEEWDEDEEDWDDEEWDEDEDDEGAAPDGEPDLWVSDENEDR